jgi:hypothetical protein
VRSLAGRLIELWRRGVEQLDDGELGVVRLSPSRTCGARRRPRDTVIEVEDCHPVFVIFVSAFTFDVTEIRESIECHEQLPSSGADEVYAIRMIANDRIVHFGGGCP